MIRKGVHVIENMASQGKTYGIAEDEFFIASFAETSVGDVFVTSHRVVCSGTSANGYNDFLVVDKKDIVDYSKTSSIVANGNSTFFPLLKKSSDADVTVSIEVVGSSKVDIKFSTKSQFGVKRVEKVLEDSRKLTEALKTMRDIFFKDEFEELEEETVLDVEAVEAVSE